MTASDSFEEIWAFEEAFNRQGVVQLTGDVRGSK
jgi:hypothetical protein